MDLGADGELRTRGRGLDGSDDLVGRAEGISALANFPAALGMCDHVNAGMLAADFLHVLRKKTLMHRAMPLPQYDAGFAQTLRSRAAEKHERVPNHHLFARDPHRVGGVAAEVLVGHEQDLFRFREGPLHRPAAFDDVQTTPPRSPQKALIAAVEFI